MKINHNELLSYPNSYDQRLFADVEQAFEMGAAGVGATIYFGSPESRRQIEEVSEAFMRAHELGMFTVLWCYLRNPAFKKDGVDYDTSADLTGQANHLGVTIEADIIKQKAPTNNGGYTAIGFGKTSPLVYEKLTSDHPVDLTRYQVANCYMGRIGLINSGGASTGANDLQIAVRTAVVNKRAGGTGLISGRKAFQRPMKDGVKILNAIQDVYRWGVTRRIVEWLGFIILRHYLALRCHFFRGFPDLLRITDIAFFQRGQFIIKFIYKRYPGGNIQFGHFLIGQFIQIFYAHSQTVPVSHYESMFPRQHILADNILPVWQHPFYSIF